MDDNNDDADHGNEMDQSSRLWKTGKPSFFVGIVGGILVGALFGNVGAGLAIGISLWLIGGLFEPKGDVDRRDP